MLQIPGESLKSYALTQLQRAMTCLAWRGSRAHAGVHQARKSMRRVRACLALGEHALGAGASMLDRELSKICEGLSSLRDAQARVESLDRLLANEPGLEILYCLPAAKRLAIKNRVDAMHEEHRHDPDFQTRRERLQVLAAAVSVLPWEHIDENNLTSSIQRSLLACDEAAEIALSRGKEKDWHRLRRRRRRLVQQHTAVESCHITLHAIVIPDRKLSTLLGEAQDISILREFFKNHSGLSKGNENLLRKFLKKEFEHLSAEAMAA